MLLYKLILVPVTLISLNAYVAPNSLPSDSPQTESVTKRKTEYAIGNIFKNMYIEGWSGHLLLQNSNDFGGQHIELEVTIEPLDLNNFNVVDFYGRQAIPLNRTEKIQYSSLNQINSYISKGITYLEPTTYRFIGLESHLQSGDSSLSVVDNIVPIPQKARVGDTGILSKGYTKMNGFNESTFIERWSLTSIGVNEARFCIASQYVDIHSAKEELNINECYIVDIDGNILGRKDTMTIHGAQGKASKHFVMP